jgi:hypothetical protein
MHGGANIGAAWWRDIGIAVENSSASALKLLAGELDDDVVAC